MAKISILLVCMWVVSIAVAQDIFQPHRYITSSDTLPYRLLHPEKIEPDSSYPLILFLHGAGERGTDNTQNLKYITELFLDAGNREHYPAYVLVPQCKPGARWTPADWFAKPNEPITSVVDLLDSLSASLPIDKTRIYVMGLSMGGYGTWYLITRYPEKFAAAVPICGGGDWNQARTIRHIPVWVFHGKKDTVVKPEQSRRMVQALKKAGGNPRYTEYKKAGHDSWTPAMQEPELFKWLFRQRL